MDFRVLVVDDERENLELLKDIIETVGCQVEVTDSGVRALEMVEREEYPLVITDLRMPGVSGFDVLRHARHANPDCMVVLCTGYATLDTAIEAIKAGAYDYITKPFTADEVLVVLKNVWERVLLIRKNRSLLEELGVYKQVESKWDVEENHESAGTPVLYNGRLIRMETSKYPGSWDGLDELRSLAELAREGYITVDEYERIKARIIEDV